MPLECQRTLFPADPEIEAKARRYASQIRQERLSRGQERLADDEAVAQEATRYEHVDVNSLTKQSDLLCSNCLLKRLVMPYRPFLPPAPVLAKRLIQ